MPAASVDEYLASLPEDRRVTVAALRDAVRAGLPPGYEESMQYGMIGYFVPHSRYPDGYHCDPRQPLPFAGVGAQKHHYGVYLFCIYQDPGLNAWFLEEYAKTGKRLDMGKGCVRFRRLEDAPLALLTEVVSRIPVDAFVERYERQIPPSARKKAKKKA